MSLFSLLDILIAYEMECPHLLQGSVGGVAFLLLFFDLAIFSPSFIHSHWLWWHTSPSPCPGTRTSKSKKETFQLCPPEVSPQDNLEEILSNHGKERATENLVKNKSLSDLEVL